MDSPTLQPIPLWVPVTLLIVLLGGWVVMNFWGEWRDSRDASKQDRREAARRRAAEETWPSTDTAAGYESAGQEPPPAPRPKQPLG
jgi:hypothetical protein